MSRLALRPPDKGMSTHPEGQIRRISSHGLTSKPSLVCAWTSVPSFIVSWRMIPDPACANLKFSPPPCGGLDRFRSVLALCFPSQFLFRGFVCSGTRAARRPSAPSTPKSEAAGSVRSSQVVDRFCRAEARPIPTGTPRWLANPISHRQLRTVDVTASVRLPGVRLFVSSHKATT